MQDCLLAWGYGTHSCRARWSPNGCSRLCYQHEGDHESQACLLLCAPPNQSFSGMHSRRCDPSQGTRALFFEGLGGRLYGSDWKMVISDKNWPKNIESLALWIPKHLGVTKAPLGYILLNDSLAPAAPDPRMGLIGSQYTPYHKEMLACFPHFHSLSALSYSDIFSSEY